MSGILTDEENAHLSVLKKNGFLIKFKKSDMKNVTKNGGIAILCGDGDVSIYDHHKAIISKRAHSIKLFGGPLLLCPSFKKYNKHAVSAILENISWGKSAKETKTFFIYFHYPCGVATLFDHSMDDVLKMAPEATKCIQDFFDPKKIITFFHVKRRNKGGKIEQNSYILK